MGLMKIMDIANELTLDRFKIGMKIAYSFFVVDSLLLIVGYMGLYGENIGAFIDPKQAIILCILFAIFSSILMCIGLTRSIMKPLKEFGKAADRIAQGDLTTDVVVSSRDELGQLADYFRKMTTNLRGVIGKVQSFSLKVANTAHELSASSEEMKASIDQISGNTQGIAEGAGQQSSKITDISKTVNEMSDLMKQAALGSERAADVAKSSNNKAQEISRKSSDILERITDIRKSVDNSAIVIRNLDGNSEKIGEIVGVITDIADQTNLLALNAAIEAARAGEHGRGFAVVAEEVRKLAEESRNSANRIIELVKEIQHGTKQAVENMEHGTMTVKEGAKTISETVSSINDVVEASENAANMFNELKEIADMQAASIDKVKSSIEEISIIAGDSAAATHEAAAATQEQSASMGMLVDIAEELANLSHELQAEISLFKQKAE